MVLRLAEAVARELLQAYGVLVITGPRQAGKTTLARELFAGRAYVSLEDIDDRAWAVRDPRGFLARFPEGAVLDEVQRAPELLSYLQGDVDRTRQPGRWLLTGSQQFGLLSNVTQSLAGRVALLPLLPFSLDELQASQLAPASLEELLFTGLYPPIHDRRLAPGLWLGNYVGTYLERDVRQLVNVQDLRTFQVFVRMCAARTGQLLNLSALAADCGITHNTAKAWLSVLETSYLVHLLPPHFNNLGKRLVKTPKLYFLDPGLAAWLVGLEGPQDVAISAHRGPLFESWVVSELLKARLHRGLRSNLYFWRDHRGLEVDLVCERHGKLIPVEMKSGQTVAADFLDNLERWRALAGDAAAPSWLVYGGETGGELRDNRILPWREIGALGTVVAV
jgi:uncharacterized protein